MQFLTKRTIEKKEDKEQIAKNLEAYFFTSFNRQYKYEVKDDFVFVISSRLKVRKKEDKLELLLSFSLLRDVIKKVFDDKVSTFTQRIRREMFKDNRIQIGERKYFLLKDFLLHIFMLNEILLKKNGKDIFIRKDIKNFDLNKISIDKYIDYIGNIVGSKNIVTNIIKNRIVDLLEAEIPQFTELLDDGKDR